MGMMAPAALASDGSEIVLASWSLSRLYDPRLFVATLALGYGAYFEARRCRFATTHIE